MRKLIFSLLLILTQSTWAGLPPTTSRVQGDSSDVTTFKYRFPNFTATHVGTLTTFGVNSVAGGGTGLASGTSGGALYFSSTGSIGSSALLSLNQPVLGGGAGAAPYSLSNGSSGQVLVSGGGTTAPAWQTVPVLPGVAWSGAFQDPGANFVCSNPSTTPTDFNTSANTTLSVMNATGITCTYHGSGSAAIDCTLPATGPYYVCGSGNITNASTTNTEGLFLSDGSGATIGTWENKSLDATAFRACGNYIAASTSVTFKMQASALVNNAMTIEQRGTISTFALQFDIGQIAGSTGGSGSGITNLIGDILANGPGSVSSTVAKVQGTTVLGTTGTGSVVFSASPTLTGTANAASINATGSVVVGTNIGIGTTSPLAAAAIDVVNSTGATQVIEQTGYGANSGFRGRYANGTVGSPSAATTGNILNFFSGRGYGTSSFASTSSGALNITAQGAFSDTSMPTSVDIMTTSTGSTVSSMAASFLPSGQLQMPKFYTSAGALQTNSSGTVSSSTLSIANGGTGQSSTPIDGQLLTGSTSGSNFVLAALLTGSGMIVTNGSGSITLSTFAPIVNYYTASTTMADPGPKCRFLRMRGIGGGGGGGSGRKGATSTARSGGGGGAAGTIVDVMIPYSTVTSWPVTITIGAAGSIGAAQATDSTNGNNGTAGGDTSFGSFVIAKGGQAGSGGTNQRGNGGVGRYGANISPAGAAGVPSNCGGNGNISTSATTFGGSGFAGCGGGGGGLTAANATVGGGDGGGNQRGDAVGSGGNAGSAGSNGSNGDTSSPFAMFGGTAGGGSGSSNSTGQPGGNAGLYGAGGGGGGAGLDATYSSGAGGTGSQGFLEVDAL